MTDFPRYGHRFLSKELIIFYLPNLSGALKGHEMPDLESDLALLLTHFTTEPMTTVSCKKKGVKMSYVLELKVDICTYIK